VFIANFSRENYFWPSCIAQVTIATLEAEEERPLRLAGDVNAIETLMLVNSLERAVSARSATCAKSEQAHDAICSDLPDSRSRLRALASLQASVGLA